MTNIVTVKFCSTYSLVSYVEWQWLTNHCHSGSQEA